MQRAMHRSLVLSACWPRTLSALRAAGGRIQSVALSAGRPISERHVSTSRPISERRAYAGQSGSFGARYLWAGAACCAAVAVATLAYRHRRGNRDTLGASPALPEFTLDELRSRRSPEAGVWVAYQGWVYDLTDYVSEHPGGSHILYAAGKDIGPFWDQDAVHKPSHVHAMMEPYKIGRLDAASLTELQHERDRPRVRGDKSKRSVILMPLDKPLVKTVKQG